MDDLLGSSFETASTNWRCTEPVALIVPLNTAACGFVRLVHLLPPFGQVHWATLHTAARCALPISDERREAVANGLTLALRRSAVPSSQRRLEWLRTLYATGGRPLPSKVQSLCCEAPAYRELGRVESVVVFEHEWADFVQEQEALLAEAGTLAFLGSDERVVMLGADDPTSLRVALFRGFSAIDFSSPHELYFALNRCLLRTFERELRDLEAGRGFSFQVEASRLANPVVNLRLPLAGSWELEEEALLRKLLAWRTRLIRLLGWPMHLPSVFAALEGVEGIVPPLGSHGVVEPFDAVAELHAYVADMEARFPLMHKLARQRWSPLQAHLAGSA